MLGVLVENGPCFVNYDSNSTTINPWSWNNHANMLYVDQPVQVGLSYDTLQNITLDLSTGTMTFLQDTDPIPEQNSTFLVGTYPSQNISDTAQGTLNGAHALWHFAQTFFREFPQYAPKDSRISIATESYGGRYGPAYSAFFEEQNQKIKDGTWNNTDSDMYIIHLDTLLIINGCIDRQIQWPSYPHIAFNNTYGIQTINETIYNKAMAAYYDPNGCRDRITNCRILATQYDPTQLGTNTTVNSICSEAEDFCSDMVRDPYLYHSGRNYYDFATFDPDPMPPPFYQGYLNQPHVQRALGVPLNWTQSSQVVSRAFRSVGDYSRPGWLHDLSYLLDNGVKIALVYGDRDYACNWIGGEAVSLAINYSRTDEFHAAGYEDIHTNDTYVGGKVRQFGNLSFSRVYQAGHEVPYYQPETAYRIFNRALFNKNIATGTVDTAGNLEYTSVGPLDTWHVKNDVPEQPLSVCYVLDPKNTCQNGEREALKNGDALVSAWVVEGENSTLLYPGLSGWDGKGWAGDW